MSVDLFDGAIRAVGTLRELRAAEEMARLRRALAQEPAARQAEDAALVERVHHALCCAVGQGAPRLLHAAYSGPMPIPAHLLARNPALVEPLLEVLPRLYDAIADASVVFGVLDALLSADSPSFVVNLATQIATLQHRLEALEQEVQRDQGIM